MSNAYTQQLYDGLNNGGCTIVQVEGYWLSDREKLIANVARCHRALTEDERELLLNDDNIMYIIEWDEKVYGQHGDFVITSTEVC